MVADGLSVRSQLSHVFFSKLPLKPMETLATNTRFFGSSQRGKFHAGDGKLWKKTNSFKDWTLNQNRLRLLFPSVT